MAEDVAKPVMNLADVETMEFGHGEGFSARLGRIGPRIGSPGIGCMLTIVPPGKKAFPFHAHHANDEMFFILEGSGEYRLGEERFAVKAMDVVAAPAGGPETAHQLINTGAADLKYLAFSTMADPEVVEYPDSGKFAAVSRFDWKNPASGKGIRYIGRTESTLDYWDGEE